jgi:outer membrane protein assembly factor BamD (BamD/ComL family)
MDSAAKISSSAATLRRRFMRMSSYVRVILASILLLSLGGTGCTADGAQQLFESAQLEERQNNPAHAKELYQEILTKYPQSEYARKAQERLRELDRQKGR